MFRGPLAASLLCLAAAAPVAAAGDSAADCEAAFAADRDGWNSCACFYRLAHETSRHDSARRRLHELAAADLPCPHFYLGSLLFEEGSDPGDHYRRAAELYAGRGQHRGVYYTRMSLARWHRGRAAYDRALAEMERAAAAARDLGDQRLAAATELEHASLGLSRGADLAALEETLVGLHRRAGEEGWEEIELAAADKLAQVRFRLGELDLARQALDRLAERYRLRDDGYAEATARLNAALGSLQGFPSEPARAAAVGRLEGALEVAEGAGNLRAQAVALRKLGELEPGPEGDELLARSLAIARRLAEPEVLYGTLLARAERLAADLPAEARRLAAEAETVRPPAGTPDFLAEGWLHRLRIAWRTSPPDEALTASLEVLDEIELLRLEQSATRAEYFAVWLPAHQWLAGTLLARAAGQPAVAADGEVSAPGSADRRAVPLAVVEPRWLGDAFSVGERMRGRILLDDAGAAAGSEPAAIDRIRAALGRDEAMLWFQLGLWRNFYGRFEGGGWLLVLQRDGTKLYALPDAGRIDPALGHFTGLFEARDGGEARAAAVLFRQLIGPAIEELTEPVERLVLVPDGALHRLPFGALRDSAGRMLGERFELSAVPSATLWAAWRAATPGRSERPALVLAAPDLAVPGGETGALGGTSARRPGGPWEPLPGARREARMIRRVLGRDSSVVEGAAASEAAVRQAAGGRFAVLHFAAHALVDERRGRRAGILLSPGAAGTGEDGLLEPAEIRRLDLDGELVVLATCRSGAGRVLYGEGPLSLAHAFFRAGAGSVVASLWPLEDEEAAALFPRFYRRLAAGESVAGSLAEAQRERARAGAPAAAWAGVVALGDGAATPFPGGLGNRPAAGGAALWLAAGLVLAAGGLWAARRRGR